MQRDGCESCGDELRLGVYHNFPPNTQQRFLGRESRAIFLGLNMAGLVMLLAIQADSMRTDLIAGLDGFNSSIAGGKQ